MRRPLLRRVSLVLACCLVLCAALSGCHGSRALAAFTAPETFDDSRTYDITFWAKNDTNKTQTEIYNRAIADFEKLYPNIHVNIRLYTDYGKIYNDVITNIATGTTPNVCITYPDHIATYLSGVNVVAPLEELFAHPLYGLGGSDLRYQGPGERGIIPEFLAECVIGDAVYAVPFMRSTEACYVNKDYVERLGFTLPETLTWDFVWQVADAAAAKNADGTFALNGQNVMLPFLYKSTDNMMIQSLWQRGAPYSTEDGEIALFGEETRAILEDAAAHTATGAFSTFKISGYPANFLNAGQCVFAVDSTAGATWMGTDAPLSDISPDKLVPFETVVYPVPQADPDHPKMISQGPSICIFNKSDPQVVLASWLFTQYLLSNEVQIAYAQTEGYVPVTTPAREDAAYVDYLSRGGEDNDLHYSVKIDATKMLLAHTADTFVTPVFNGSASLRDAAGQLIENTVKSVRRKETVDDAYYDKLFASVTSLYRLDSLGTSVTGEVDRDLGPLPGTAVELLAGLGAVWLVLAALLIGERLRKKRRASAGKT